jgi:hypothetical protein
MLLLLLLSIQVHEDPVKIGKERRAQLVCRRSDWISKPQGD